MRHHRAAAACAATADSAQLEQLTAQGRDRLDGTLPLQSPPERLVDSALRGLIHPLNVVTPMRKDAIVNLAQARLKGEIAIRRYARFVFLPGQCPALYFLKHGRYIANVHTPLA